MENSQPHVAKEPTPQQEPGYGYDQGASAQTPQPMVRILMGIPVKLSPLLHSRLCEISRDFTDRHRNIMSHLPTRNPLIWINFNPSMDK